MAKKQTWGGFEKQYVKIYGGRRESWSCNEAVGTRMESQERKVIL